MTPETAVEHLALDLDELDLRCAAHLVRRGMRDAATAILAEIKGLRHSSVKRLAWLIEAWAAGRDLDLARAEACWQATECNECMRRALNGAPGLCGLCHRQELAARAMDAVREGVSA